MQRFFQKNLLVLGLASLMLAFPAQGSINKSVKIEDGASASGASSVNGSVTVGSNATVNGKLSTVNGTIRIGDGSVIEDAKTVNGGIKLGSQVRTQDLETVNGAIKVGDDSSIEGNVSAVNGSILLERGTQVTRNVSNVNGDIDLRNADVGGDVSSVSGDIELADQSVIQGNLIVEKARGGGWFSKESRPPTIIIGPGSRVEGVIRLEREVKLFISESASVGGVEGVMTMDDAERFSGNRP